MKNNFFRKIPILFLTGTMLFGVGCKDYDDDIDSINKRVDALEGEITKLNSVAERFEAVEGVYTRLKDFQPSDYVKNDKLTSELNAAKTAWMQEVSNTYLTKSGLEDALKALKFSFANAETVAAMKTALDTYFAKPGADVTDGQKKQIEEYLAGILAAGEKTLGEAMSKYLQGYVTDTELSDYMKSADFEQELYDELKTNQAKYKDAVEGYITTYINSLAGDNKLVVSSELTAAQTAMDTKYESLKATVDAISVKVEDLIAAIQSLEFVPEYADGRGSMGYAKIGEEVFYKQVKVSYQVRPAAQAAKIAALKSTQDVALVIKEVKNTRVAAPALKIDDIAVTDADNGIFEITATPENFTVVTGDETSYSIAFSIRKAAADGKADGIDRTTSYVNLVPVAEMELIHAIRNTETKKIVSPNDDPAIEKEIAFDDTKTGVAPFAGYEAVYVTNDSSEKPYTAAEMAEMGYTVAAPEFKQIKDMAAFDADGSPIEDAKEIAKVFTLPENPGIDMVVKMASNASANKKAKLTCTYVFMYGETPMEIKTALTVIGTEVKKQMADAELVWKFADATSYENDGISIESAVDAGTELAPGIKTLSALVNDGSFTPSIEVYDGEKTVEANVTLKAKGSEGADANTAVITFANDIAWNKSYKVVATYEGENMNVILTTDAITLTGMPAEFKLTVPTGNIHLAGKGNTVGQSVTVDALYNDNKAALEKHFANIVEFSNFMAAATSKAKNTTDATTGEPAEPIVLNDATALAFTFAMETAEKNKPQMSFIATVYDTDIVKAGQKILYGYEFAAKSGTQTMKVAVSYELTLTLPAVELNYDAAVTSGDVTLKADYVGTDKVYTLTAELNKYLLARINDKPVLANAFDTEGLSLKFSISKPAKDSKSTIDETTGALTYKAKTDETCTAELCYHGIATGVRKDLKVKQPQQVLKTATVTEYKLVRAEGGNTSIAISSNQGMFSLKNYENQELIVDKNSDGSAIFGSVKEHDGKSAYAMYGATATPGTPTLKYENGAAADGYQAKFDENKRYLLTITHSDIEFNQAYIVEIPVTIKCPYQDDQIVTVRIKLVQK